MINRDEWKITDFWFDAHLPGLITAPTIQISIGHQGHSVIIGWLEGDYIQIFIFFQMLEVIIYFGHPEGGRLSIAKDAIIPSAPIEKLIIF